MKIIEIKNENEFEPIIEHVNVNVGSRQKRRKQETKEIFSFINFLKLKQKVHSLNFPITIKKRESPDFELIEGDKILGFEITESTNEIYQAILAYCDSNPKFTYDPCSIEYGMTIQNTDWKRLLIESGSKASSKGWGGFQPEQFSAKLARDALCKKLPLLGGWKRTFRNKINILLHSNSPGWNHDYERFTLYLKKLILPLLDVYKGELHTVSYLSSDGKRAILDIRKGYDSFVDMDSPNQMGNY